MAKKSKKTETVDKDALLKIAVERHRDGKTYWQFNFDEAEADLEFLLGNQWPSEVKTQRELERRPCLTNNVLPTFVGQVIGDQRQNRPTIKISPVSAVTVPAKTEDGTPGEQEELKIASTDGKTQYSLAECMTAITRSIEYACDAESAYDEAFEASLGSSFGFLRLLSDYTSDDSFEQDLKIESILNQFSVTIDPSAKKQDKSDADWIFVEDMMLRDAFKAEYPDAAPEPIGDQGGLIEGSWFTENAVRVTEYFTREPITKEINLMSDGRTIATSELKDIQDELAEKGITVKRTRKVKTYKVVWRKITAHDILEGPIDLPYTTIPIVPVFGKRVVIKDKIHYQSLIRHSKDAQRMANYWDSAGTENVGIAPKAPFIGMEGHIEGYEDEWKSANTSNLSILTYIPQFDGDPGPRRQPSAAVPSAELTLGMAATDKIKSTLGMFDASVGAKGNATSGKQELIQQRQGDTGTFVFVDNLSKAITRIGKLIVEAIPHYYDAERIARLKFEDGTEDYVKLNEQVFDDEKKKWVTVHDLSIAKYDVIVTTGPAYNTQRVEAAESMIAFAKAVPAAAAVMGDLIAQNQDWPGADVIAERLKKIVPPNLLSQSEREEIAKDAPEPTPPTPEQELQGKELDVRNAEAQAKIATAQASVENAKQNTIQEQLQTEQAKSKLAEIEAKAEGGSAEYQAVRELVAQALAELKAPA